MKPQTQSDFNKLKKEIRVFLELTVYPAIQSDSSYLTTKVAGALYDLRHSIFKGDRQSAYNNFVILRKEFGHDEKETAQV